jgi:hypothetical protein
MNLESSSSENKLNAASHPLTSRYSLCYYRIHQRICLIPNFYARFRSSICTSVVLMPTYTLKYYTLNEVGTTKPHV